MLVVLQNFYRDMRLTSVKAYTGSLHILVWKQFHNIRTWELELLEMSQACTKNLDLDHKEFSFVTSRSKETFASGFHAYKYKCWYGPGPHEQQKGSEQGCN